jgi:hypothetical protein
MTLVSASLFLDPYIHIELTILFLQLQFEF